MGLLPFFLIATAAGSQPLAIVDVSVIVPGRDSAVGNQTVLIKGESIVAMGSAGSVKVPLGVKIIDGSGKFLMPGLWDMHVHWYEEKSLSLFVANGVLGIRQMFGKSVHLDWRKRVEAGTLLGPRMIVGSPIVDGKDPAWPGSIEFDRPNLAKELVKRLKSEGWDFIKVYEWLNADAFRALAKEAKSQDIPFEGHLPMSMNVLEAAQLGQRTLEHLGNVRESCTPNERDLRTMLQAAVAAPNRFEALDHGYNDFFAKHPNNRMNTLIAVDVCKKLSKTGVWICPTLTVLQSLGRMNDPEFVSDPRLKYMSPSVREAWKPSNDVRMKDWTRDDFDYWKLDGDRKFSIVKMLLDTGNRFLAGTDCLNPNCFPGFSLHDELHLLVQSGLSPSQAIEAATLNPARYAGQERLWGSISVGKRADAVLLTKNPLSDIRNTTSIDTVIQDGRVYDRAALDAMLKSNEHP